MPETPPTTVEEYLAGFDAEPRHALDALRALVHECLPGAGEKISYQIPTVTLDGRAVLYFAGWKKHMSLYPVPSGDADYEALVAPYRAAKDAVHLRYDAPLPTEVVVRIVGLLAARHAAVT